jgi:hypothetical protein
VENSTDQLARVPQKIKLAGQNFHVNIVWRSRGNFADALVKNFSPTTANTAPAGIFRNLLQNSTAHCPPKNAAGLYCLALFHESTALITTTSFPFSKFQTNSFVPCCGCENGLPHYPLTPSFLAALKFLNAKPFPQPLVVAYPF